MSARVLLEIIAGPEASGLIEVRCRSPRTGRIEAREWFDASDHAACVRYMERHAQRLDVYVGVAPRTKRSGGKSAIRHSWLLYVDADSAEAAERVRKFMPQPSLIVRSGTGSNVHAYWSLTHPISVMWFERANRRLAHHLGADVKVTDAARILRPPGTLNWKTNPPVRVEIERTTDTCVSVACLVRNFPDPPGKSPLPVRPRSDVYADDPLLGVSAERYYTVLTGRPVTAGNVQCPFHGDGQERNPSMRLYDLTWYCFGCCEGGSVYEFGAKLWGMGKRGAEFVALRERLSDALG